MAFSPPYDLPGERKLIGNRKSLRGGSCKQLGCGINIRERKWKFLVLDILSPHDALLAVRSLHGFFFANHFDVPRTFRGKKVAFMSPLAMWPTKAKGVSSLRSLRSLHSEGL